MWSETKNKFEFKSHHDHQNAEITTITDEVIANQKYLLVGDDKGFLTLY